MTNKPAQSDKSPAESKSEAVLDKSSTAKIVTEDELLAKLSEFEQLDPSTISKAALLGVWRILYPLYVSLTSNKEEESLLSKATISRFHEARKVVEDTHHFTEHNQFLTHKYDLNKVVQDAIARYESQNSLKPVSIVRNINFDDLALECGLSRNVIEMHFDNDQSILERLDVISTQYKLYKLESYVDSLNEYIKYNKKQKPRVHSQALSRYKALIDFHASWQPLFEQYNIDTTAFDKAYAALNKKVPDEFKEFFEKSKVQYDKHGNLVAQKYKATDNNSTARLKVLEFLKKLQKDPTILEPIRTNLRSVFNADFANACGVKVSRLKLMLEETPDLKAEVEEALEQHYYYYLLIECEAFPAKAKEIEQVADLVQDYHRYKNHVLFMFRMWKYHRKGITYLKNLLSKIKSSYKKALVRLDTKFEPFNPSLEFAPNPYDKDKAPARYQSSEKALALAKNLRDKALELLQKEKLNPTHTLIRISSVYEAVGNAKYTASSKMPSLAAVHDFIKLVEQQRRLDFLNHHLDLIKQDPSDYIKKYDHYIDIKRLLVFADVLPREYAGIDRLPLDDLYANMDEVQGVLLEAKYSKLS